VKTWYDAFQFEVSRPYRKTGNFGWGAGVNFTSAARSLAESTTPTISSRFRKIGSS